MAAEPLPNANALLAEVLDLPAESRDAFLCSLRAERPDVACEVEELLAASQATEAEMFLAGGPLNDASATALTQDGEETIDAQQTLANQTHAFQYPTTDEDLVGAVIADDYELRGMLGKGGMGVVYRALQRSLNREVALKLIPTRLLNSDEQVARFYVEAEAAAGLDHRGIVPVYDIGQATGVHYYAMAMVEGDALDKFLRQDKRLPVKRVAQIMEQAARAVQHAHDHAVIHRDIKPANILLDKDGQPRIADFGLAKIAGGEELTMTGQVMGTPSYMAPEQAEGDSRAMSTHVDTYALGATLYALLAGRPPFTAPTLMGTLRKVQNDAPAPLPTNIPLDLRTICQRCLAKKPADRYESAGALADDLDRYARGFPIAARPLSAAQRTLRWAQRNPLIAGSLVAVIACLAGAAVVSSAFAIRANRALAASEASAARLGSAIEETFVFASEGILAEEPGMQTARRSLLESAQNYYQQLQTAGHKSDADAARTSHLLGQVQASLGEWAAAEQSLQRAIELRKKLAEQEPTSAPLAAAVADSHHQRAKLANDQWGSDSDLSEAQRLALLKRWEADASQAVTWRATASQLDPDSPERKRLLANALMSQGIAATELASATDSQQLFEQAAQQLDSAQAMRQSILAGQPDAFVTQRDLALGFIALADLAEVRKQTEEPHAGLRQALELRQQAAETLRALPLAEQTQKNRSMLATCYQFCGESYFQLGQREPAQQSFQQMQEVMQKLLRQNPNVLRYRTGLAAALFNLGQVRIASGNPDGYHQFEQAQQTLADAMAISPTHAEAREMLISYTRSFAFELAAADLQEVALLQVRRAISILEAIPLEGASQETDLPAIASALERLRSVEEEVAESADAI